jgi:hypothetical protein
MLDLLEHAFDSAAVETLEHWFRRRVLNRMLAGDSTDWRQLPRCSWRRTVENGAAAPSQGTGGQNGPHGRDDEGEPP